MTYQDVTMGTIVTTLGYHYHYHVLILYRKHTKCIVLNRHPHPPTHPHTHRLLQLHNQMAASSPISSAAMPHQYLVSGNCELPGSVVYVFIFFSQLCQLWVSLVHVVLVQPVCPVLVHSVPEDAHCQKEWVLIASGVPNP